MGVLILFDVPVYRLAREDYYQWYDAMIERRIAEFLEPEYTQAIVERAELNIRQNMARKFGAWDFNEVVGYIRLHYVGREVRGEYFSSEKRRTTRTRTKVFSIRTHKLAAEIRIEEGSDSIMISSIIKSYLNKCQKELPKGRVIDSSNFDAIGPFLDWRGLLEN